MNVNTETLIFTKTDPRAKEPAKAHSHPLTGDAAYDLFSLEKVVLKPLEQQIVDTGIKVLIPSGFWIKFHERSGLAAKGIQVHGGVIDNGYTGNLKVILYNSSNFSITLDAAKAITQFTLEKMRPVFILEASEEEFNKWSSDRLRGEKGFGSTDESSK